MFFLKYLLLSVSIVMFAVASATVVYDLWLEAIYRRALAAGTQPSEPEPVRWRTGVALALLAWLPLLIALSIVIVPSGRAGVRISQLSGTLPGTLYPGSHLIVPLIDHVDTFDMRDKLFTTGVSHDARGKSIGEPLNVQAKEGLTVGLAITVRYQLDPHRLDYIQSRLPQPVSTEIVPPVVASAWRELSPNYTVREIFSTQREEVRRQAAATITRKLAADGIIVKEVMLRDIQLPPEYAKGLERLLLKEQEDDQLSIQTDIQQKNVRIAELEAEAEKVREIKQAEGAAQSQVIAAKGQADAMQYTLPLKQKQIEQSRLEAEARKEATIQNADAEAQAKVIDAKAELQRRDLLAQAEANRIRLTAVADTERMKTEGAVLKNNPLLINKIIAERLSDKIQLMIVPSDGKYFFANDVFRGFASGAAPQQQTAGGDEPGMQSLKASH